MFIRRRHFCSCLRHPIMSHRRPPAVFSRSLRRPSHRGRITHTVLILYVAALLIGLNIMYQLYVRLYVLSDCCTWTAVRIVVMRAKCNYYLVRALVFSRAAVLRGASCLALWRSSARIVIIIRITLHIGSSHQTAVLRYTRIQ